MTGSQGLGWVSAVCVLVVAGSLNAAPPPSPAPPPRPQKALPGNDRASLAPAGERLPPARVGADRWTASTPDEMLDLALRRGEGKAESALAGLAVAHALSSRASARRAEHGLSSLGQREGDIAAQAHWLAAELDPTPAPSLAGLVRGFSILGPFQDSGGGLARREGPEQAGQTWGDPKASYAWGAYEVRWHSVPAQAVSARGIPLDLFIRPRKESCSYLAAKVSPPSRAPFVLYVAASGSVRLIWDGADVAASEEDHLGLIFDRIAARIEPSAGDHLLAVKVCSGALDDEGRVRVRATDTAGKPLDLVGAASLQMAGPFAKPSVTLLPTALARAIEVGNDPSSDRALAASVVRTLGRADDLRSPRSPGLLDKVASLKATTPDALAMAGWIAPFGASRSGSLNLAIERATAVGDTPTASFAQRRLAAARLSSGWADWVMATLLHEPLASDDDSEAHLLRAMARGGLRLESLRRLALSEMLETARHDGDRASAALWEEIAKLADGLDPNINVDAKNALIKLVPEARDTAWVRAMTSKNRAAVKAAADEALGSGAMTSDSEVLDLAGALADAGLHDDARRVLAYGVELCPNRAALWSSYAESLFQTGRVDDGNRALSRARQLEPAEVQYRAEASYRGEAQRLATRRPVDGQPSDGSDEDHEADTAYLVEPSVFLTRMKEHPAAQGEVFDRQLHWTRAVTLHADRRVSQLIHYSREIVIEPRTQEELYEAIPAEGDETEILRARVHRAKGGVALAEEQKSEGGRPSIRWPDLKTGDVVEVAIRTWTSGPVGRRGDPPFYFIDYAGSVVTHPLLYNDVIVDSPSDRPLAVDVLHGKPDRQTDETKAGRHVVRMIWDAPINVPDEPLAPKSSEVLPTIVGSTFANWKEFREWYQAAVEGFTEPDDQVRRLAFSLTKGKATRDEKVRAIFNYVADDIRYVNYVSGEWWLPNRPQQLLARRQGDCDDKAILLITLLRAIGIEATEVLVQTRYTAQPSILLAPRAAVPLFDHGIAYLPGQGGAPGQWLDATSPQSRLGPLPSMDARAQALFATQGPPAVVQTPSASPQDHGVEGTWRIKLTATGAGDLDATEKHVGDHAFGLRSSLGEKDARAQWVEQNLVGGWFPTVEVGKEVDFEGNLPGGAARVRYHAHSDGLARKEGRELVLPVAPTTTMTSQLAPLLKRKLSVVLPPNTAPSHQTRTIYVDPPAGYVAGELPNGGEENGGEFGLARLEIKHAPGGAPGVVIQRTVVFDMSSIPVEKYEAWRAWLQRVDALLHRSIRFAPRGGEGKKSSPR